MFGSSQSGVNAYQKIGVETGVLAASPHKLIVMLFEGAIVAIVNARQQMENGDIPNKGRSISKAISIIENGLRASLNKQVGGEIAINLDNLYEYMSRQLLLANLNNDENTLADVQKLLADLKDAWETIAPPPVIAQEPQKTGYDQLQPRPTHAFEA
ncbi:flagellar export chaperone FliS [Undibacterium oligocarboniphilum]|uniref:Flagellar secretion chaperone FliS n=1 Tax=Undibacterium oligocarboniphilum TaxID=666702 RepID=A0A850QNI2_9BURK|nr:flagellar export chaperone FliS [Undibacterium oligocarboniphilum]MBC3870269.1 flagellar export chaperone FliS [Undibacterium oligocarboniphilum]NVO78260.1 flagellar export chaperone FliS [Undibacterium oligocarboniphilum]